MQHFPWTAVLLINLLCGAGPAAAGDAGSTIALTVTQADYDGGRVYLPVRFGNFMGSMRLDTGASTARVTLADWNKDLPSVAQSVSTGASGQTTRCDDVEARNVELKATQGNNIARSKYLVTRCAAGDGDDLLGLNFFKGARFNLDFERRELVFPADAPAPANAKPFRLLGPDHLVGIDLRAGHATAVGLFDTGAEICAVDQRFVDKHKNLFTLVKKKGKASEAGGNKFAPQVYKIKEIDLPGGLVLRDVYALVYDFGALRDALGRRTQFILGYNFLSKFNWELDFRSPSALTWDAKPR
ncbi:MAG: retropepsin-like aspartic protease [Methylocystis sp.]